MQFSVLCKIDVSSAVDLPGKTKIAAEVFLPDSFLPEIKPSAVLFCFPGGGCNRHYFDLQVALDFDSKVAPDAGGTAESEHTLFDHSFSFARAMTEHGFIVVTVDHLGIGDSSWPVDCLDVTTERVAAANACAVTQLLAKIVSGTLCDTLPALKNIKSYGLGHSMGGMLTVIQQDMYSSFIGIALLGFSNCGMESVLGDYGKSLIANPILARQENVEFAKQQFGRDYFYIQHEDPNAVSRKTSRVLPKVAESLVRARGHLITVPAALSLIRGCVLKESHQVEVPVLLIAGDEDICDPTIDAAKQFPKSKQISTLDIENCGHMHFVYDGREQLVEKVAQWITAS